MAVKVQFYLRTEAEVLALTNSTNGALYFTTDKQNIYRGNGSVPSLYTGAIVASSRPGSPIPNKLYIIGSSSNYIIESYIDGLWETLSGGVGSDELVKVGASGTPDYLSDERFIRDVSAHILLKLSEGKILTGNSSGIAVESDFPEQINIFIECGSPDTIYQADDIIECGDQSSIYYSINTIDEGVIA